MADSFRDAFEGLKQTAEALIQANEGIKRAVQGALDAKEEHEDLRETVRVLQSLVIEQTREIRELRDDIRGRG